MSISPATLMPIPPANGLAAHIIQNLGQAIVRGSFRPLDTFPTEQELCVKFGVSRTIVREAMKALSAKGLLESRPKRGARIREKRHWIPLDLHILDWIEKDEQFYQDLIELRRMVEIPAAELAAVRATKANIIAMEQALAEMVKAEAEHRPGLFKEGDMKLHRELGRSCQNELIEQLFSIITPLVEVSLEANIHLLGIAQTVPLHRSLVDAVKHRNPTEARSAITNIIDGAWLDMHNRGDRSQKLEPTPARKRCK